MTDQSTITKGSSPLAYQTMDVDLVLYMKAIHILACLASMPDYDENITKLQGSSHAVAYDLGYPEAADLAYQAFSRACDIIGPRSLFGNDYSTYMSECYAEAECLLREGFVPGEQIFP